MKRRFAEETILFLSVIKWVALASGSGALIGLVVAGFLQLLAWCTAIGQALPTRFYCFQWLFF